MPTQSSFDITLKISPDQLLEALRQLPAEEKLRIAEWLKMEAEAEKLVLKKVSFTVLKTEGRFYRFDREEGNER